MLLGQESTMERERKFCKEISKMVQTQVMLRVMQKISNRV